MDNQFKLHLDNEGHITFEGEEIQDPQFAFAIQRTLEEMPDGSFLAKWQGKNVLLEFEDAPYIVQDVALHKDHHGHLNQVDLIFPGGYTEILDPETLYVSPSNVLYCQVRKRKFAARFMRKSYFHLAPFIQEDVNHNYYVEVGNRRYRIAEHPSTV